jgi:hypothetical protein
MLKGNKEIPGHEARASIANFMYVSTTDSTVEWI